LISTKEIDFLQAINLIDVAKNHLIVIRSEQGCKDLVDQTKLFSIENNLTERDFSQVRLRRKKLCLEN